MNKLEEVKEDAQAGGVFKRTAGSPDGRGPNTAKMRWQTVAAVPLAVIIALVVHWYAARKEPPAETFLYTVFLAGLLLAFHQCGSAAVNLDPPSATGCGMDVQSFPPAFYWSLDGNW